MGKVTFTQLQKSIFEKVVKDPLLPKHFYFTGGTALSAFYLHHRESEDLDFFSEHAFDNDLIIPFIDKLSHDLATPYRFTERERTRIFEFVKKDKLLIKIDFVYYPYQRVKKGLDYKGIEIDSLLDIATNKLLTINQRAEVKDFVDLYFLLKEFTIWDLMYAVEEKFQRETDLVLLGSDFMKVQQFDFLPKMLVPLQLQKLQDFFKKKAKELAKEVVE